ncbi:MAG: hypothetical protein KBS85_00810 [Lachnospiraceae bacterium]|nr:hypothetical protein [Candidatus Merdinaster equi]
MKNRSRKINTKFLFPLILLNMILLFFMFVVIETNKNYVEQPHLLDDAIVETYGLDKEPVMVKEAYPYNGELLEANLLSTFDSSEKKYNESEVLAYNSDPNKFFAENEDWIFGPADDETGFLVATSKKTDKVIPLADFYAANIIIFDNSLYFTDTNYELYSDYKDYQLPSDRKVGGAFYRISNIDSLDKLTTNPQYHRFGNDTYRVFQVETDGSDIYALTLCQNEQGRYVGEYFRLDADAQSVGTIRPMGDRDTFVASATTATHLYLEVCHMDDSSYNTNQILCIDKSGRIEDTRCMNGTGLSTCDGKVVFQSTEDMYLYAMDESGTKAKVISQYPVASFVTQNGYIDAIAANDLAVNFRITDRLPDSPFEETSLLYVGDWGNMVDVSPAVTGTFDRAAFTMEESYAASIPARNIQKAPFRLRRDPYLSDSSADGTDTSVDTNGNAVIDSDVSSEGDSNTDAGDKANGDASGVDNNVDGNSPDNNSVSSGSSIPVDNIIPAMDEYFYYITHGGSFRSEPVYSAKGTADFNNRYFYGQTIREAMMDAYVDVSDFKKYKGDVDGAVEYIRENSADYILGTIYSGIEATYQVNQIANDNSVAIVRVHQTTYAHMHTATSAEIDQLSRDFKNSGRYNITDWTSDEAMYKAKAGVYVLEQLMELEPCDYTYDVLLIYNDVAGIWELSLDVDYYSVEQVFLPEESSKFKGDINTDSLKPLSPLEAALRELEEDDEQNNVDQENGDSSSSDDQNQDAGQNNMQGPELVQAPAKKQVMVFDDEAVKKNPYYHSFKNVLTSMTPEEYYHYLSNNNVSFQTLYQLLNKSGREEISYRLNESIRQLEETVQKDTSDLGQEAKEELECLKWAKYQIEKSEGNFSAGMRSIVTEGIPGIFGAIADAPNVLAGKKDLLKAGRDMEREAKEAHMRDVANNWLLPAMVEVVYYKHFGGYQTGDYSDHDYSKYYYKKIEI